MYLPIIRDISFLAKPLLYQHEKCPRIDQNNPVSNWRCLVGITTNPAFKIRPSFTTSKEGLKTLNIHEETTRI